MKCMQIQTIVVNIIITYRYCIRGLGKIPGQQVFKSKEDMEKVILLDRILGVIGLAYVVIYIVPFILIPIIKEIEISL